MLNQTLVIIHRSMLACLLLVAFVVAIMTSTRLGQVEIGSNPLYQGAEVAGAIIMANHNFEG